MRRLGRVADIEPMLHPRRPGEHALDVLGRAGDVAKARAPCIGGVGNSAELALVVAPDGLTELLAGFLGFFPECVE